MISVFDVGAAEENILQKKKIDVYKRQGIDVVSVVLESIHPPIDIAEIYQRTISAGIDAEKYILNAKALAAVTIAKAEKSYDTAVKQANAENYTKVANARSEVAEFMAGVEADVYKRQSEDAFSLPRYRATCSIRKAARPRSGAHTKDRRPRLSNQARTLRHSDLLLLFCCYHRVRLSRACLLYTSILPTSPMPSLSSGTNESLTPRSRIWSGVLSLKFTSSFVFGL